LGSRNSLKYPLILLSTFATSSRRLAHVVPPPQSLPPIVVLAFFAHGNSHYLRRLPCVPARHFLLSVLALGRVPLQPRRARAKDSRSAAHSPRQDATFKSLRPCRPLVTVRTESWLPRLIALVSSLFSDIRLLFVHASFSAAAFLGSPLRQFLSAPAYASSAFSAPPSTPLGPPQNAAASLRLPAPSLSVVPQETGAENEVILLCTYMLSGIASG